MQRAKSFISKNPGKFIILTGIRIRDFWLGAFWRGNNNYGFRTIRHLIFILLAVTAVLGIPRTLAKKPDVLLLPIGYLLFLPLVYYMVHSIAIDRYRAPIIPIIIILASCKIITVFKGIKEKLEVS